ncbi:MAG: hypothetical protein GY832_21530 [Chloroflexi bacterium]|nr:hypothetical protein [Chloroflexota bacterium]
MLTTHNRCKVYIGLISLTLCFLGMLILFAAQPEISAAEGRLESTDLVVIQGPSTGQMNEALTFTATLTPGTISFPVLYTWNATNQEAITDTTHSLTNTTTLTWSTTGTQVVSVTISQPATPTVHIAQDFYTLTIQGPTFIWLPLILKVSPPGIYGQVTYQGQPAIDIVLTLWHFDSEGYGYVPFRHTRTQQDGGYRFATLPDLDPQQSSAMYYVTFNNGEYGNVDDSNHLSYWSSFAITHYVEGSNVRGGDFDIADVQLVEHSQMVTLPFTFEWQRRIASPHDDYTFEVYKQLEYMRFPWHTAFDLGYVGSHTLETLPYDFELDTEYQWDLHIKNPDGGFGVSRARQVVVFVD